VLVNAQGIGLVGPTLIALGHRKSSVGAICADARAEEIWCQGYSEPGSGSDLASLQTRAVEDGDYFVINGQKVWTPTRITRTCVSAGAHRPRRAQAQGHQLRTGGTCIAPAITVRPLTR